MCFFHVFLFSRCLFQQLHQIERFKFRNFKNCLGRSSPSLFSRPRSFLGFVLDSGWALKSRALRALYLGFARYRPSRSFDAQLRPWVQTICLRWTRKSTLRRCFAPFIRASPDTDPPATLTRGCALGYKQFACRGGVVKIVATPLGLFLENEEFRIRVVHGSDGPAGRVGSGHNFAGFWWIGSDRVSTSFF